MPSLRRRFLSGTGILVGIQLLTSGLVLASWWSVVQVSDGLSTLSGGRLSVLAYATAVREQYVHQAHSFVEGGPGHLDHYGHAAEEAASRLTALSVLPLAGAADTVRALEKDHEAFSRWFDEVADQELRPGVDRARAVDLHEEAEARVARIEDEVGALLAAVERRQTEEQDRLKVALQRAVLASVALALVSVGLQLGIARRLASAVLVPLTRLSEAATRFGSGDRAARATESGDEELDDLARSFNAMFAAVSTSEEQRVRAERLAALGEMSAAIAHELNNPLTVILGSTTDPVVGAEAEHASRVVRGLLGFARPGEEREGPVDLSRLATEAVSRHGPLADARDVTLELRASEPLSVTTTPAAARQILDNLLSNAIQAAPPGSTVEVEVDGEGLHVLDHGLGIPPVLRPRLYEPFATGRHGGTGLGLAVCQRIARAQGGALTHEDRSGGGTVATWRPGGPARNAAGPVRGEHEGAHPLVRRRRR